LKKLQSSTTYKTAHIRVLRMVFNLDLSESLNLSKAVLHVAGRREAYRKEHLKRARNHVALVKTKKRHGQEVVEISDPEDEATEVLSGSADSDEIVVSSRRVQPNRPATYAISPADKAAKAELKLQKDLVVVPPGWSSRMARDPLAVTDASDWTTAKSPIRIRAATFIVAKLAEAGYEGEPMDDHKKFNLQYRVMNAVTFVNSRVLARATLTPCLF
jgi:hypothetical protein